MQNGDEKEEIVFRVETNKKSENKQMNTRKNGWELERKKRIGAQAAHSFTFELREN